MCSNAAQQFSSAWVKGWICLQVAALLLATYRTLLPWLRDDKVSPMSLCASCLHTAKSALIHVNLQLAILLDAGAGADAQRAHGWPGQRWLEVSSQPKHCRLKVPYARPLCDRPASARNLMCHFTMQGHAAWHTVIVPVAIQLAVNAAAGAAA
jgi:hypothetical protein